MQLKMNIKIKSFERYCPYDQVQIDNTLIELDGTSNKSKIGANSIYQFL